MNTKSSWVLLGLVILAALFMPIVPNVTQLECKDGDISCENMPAYISVYHKFLGSQ